MLQRKEGIIGRAVLWQSLVAPVVPNFCPQATRKSQIFHTNHNYAGNPGFYSFRALGLPSIFLTAQPSKSLKKPLLRQKGDNIPSTGKVIQHLFNIVYRLIFSDVLL